MVASPHYAASFFNLFEAGSSEARCLSLLNFSPRNGCAIICLTSIVLEGRKVGGAGGVFEPADRTEGVLVLESQILVRSLFSLTPAQCSFHSNIRLLQFFAFCYGKTIIHTIMRQIDLENEHTRETRWIDKAYLAD